MWLKVIQQHGQKTGVPLGTFPAPLSSTTMFAALNDSTAESYINADCNGIKKKIKVVVDQFSITINYVRH